MKAKSIIYKIGGEDWRFTLTSDRSYNRKFESTSDAVCLLREKEVWLKRGAFYPNVIAHELMHVLFDQSNHSSAGLDGEQIEELACEIVARAWADIPSMVMAIYNQLKPAV